MLTHLFNYSQCFFTFIQFNDGLLNMWTLFVYSLGQGSAWQLCVSRPSPSQSLPPLCGTGALQWRIRVISPSPHVTEQDDQGDHKLQPPSWRTVSAKQCYYKRDIQWPSASYHTYSACIRTSAVTFSQTALACLNRGSRTCIACVITRAPPLLSAAPTRDCALSPLWPRRPAILAVHC